ncbi:hypothetical protein SAMN04515674_102164 [Pseudarcicella hirudinis]|uniref:Uncharacterized protein n=1 Tax=Pseudarcicella hirudinis TaxID=1079859 RepID=A0A1I5NXG8_9BACT|nr:hypothetical protein [Pseudarcicella hirudinis]SFP26484.1 hypothetical protein SAMN04515674_102164 [Pseudarcicella hirudinis]
MSFKWICIYISSIAILFPMIVGIIKINYFTKPLRTIYIAIIIALILEILSWVMPFLTGSNHWAFNVLNVFEFSLLAFFYYQLAENKRLKKWMLFITTFFTLFFLSFYILHLEVLNRYNSLVNSLICLLLTIFSLGYFYQLLLYPKTDKISEYPYFWITVAVLLNFSGNFFLTLFIEFMLFGTKDKSLSQLVIINYILLFVFRFFLGLGLLYSRTLNKLEKIVDF